MLIASAALYIVGKELLGRPFDSATTKASVATTTKRLRGWRAMVATTAFGSVFLLAVVLHVSVILTSFSATGAWYRSILPTHWTLEHYRHALGDDLAMRSILNSIGYAAGATVLA